MGKRTNRLQKLGVEDQLNLAKCLRMPLTKLGFEKLASRNQREFARGWRQQWLGGRRCSRRSMGEDETLPKPAVAENSLDDIRLSTFDETDDLHCAAAFRTFQWIDFVDSLDQRRPRGNRTRARGTVGVTMSVDSGPIDGYLIRVGSPQPASRPRRVDYEFERCGTACVFIFTEPLAGWRQVRGR